MKAVAVMLAILVSHLAAASEKPKIKEKTWLRSTETKPLATIAINTNTVRSVQFSADGKSILACDSDSLIYLYDLSQKKVVSKCQLANPTAVAKIANILNRDLKTSFKAIFGTEQGTAISGAYNNDLIIWDLKAQSQLKRLSGHTAPVNRLMLTPDKTILISQSQFEINFWETRTFKIIHSISAKILPSTGPLTTAKDGFTACALTADGTRLALLAGAGSMFLVDLPSFKLQALRTDNHYVYQSAYFGALAIAPDGLSLCTGTQDGGVILWDARTGTKIREFDHRDAPFETHREIWDVQFSPDGDFVFSASKDGTVRMWPLRFASTAPLRYFGLHFDRGADNQGASVIAFSPNGQTLATGGVDAKIRLWDLSFLPVIPQPLSVDDLIGLNNPKLATRLARSTDIQADFTPFTVKELQDHGFASEDVMTLLRGAYNTSFIRERLAAQAKSNIWDQTTVDAWALNATDMGRVQRIIRQEYCYGFGPAAREEAASGAMPASESDSENQRAWVRKGKFFLLGGQLPASVLGTPLLEVQKALGLPSNPLGLGTAPAVVGVPSGQALTYMAPEVPWPQIYFTHLPAKFSVCLRTSNHLPGWTLAIYPLSRRHDGVEDVWVYPSLPPSKGPGPNTAIPGATPVFPLKVTNSKDSVVGQFYRIVADFPPLPDGLYLDGMSSEANPLLPPAGLVFQVGGSPPDKGINPIANW